MGATPAVITLSCVNRFGALRRMEASEAEKLKARRTQRLLYALVAVMIGVPVILFVLRSR